MSSTQITQTSSDKLFENFSIDAFLLRVLETVCPIFTFQVLSCAGISLSGTRHHAPDVPFLKKQIFFRLRDLYGATCAAVSVQVGIPTEYEPTVTTQ